MSVLSPLCPVDQPAKRSYLGWVKIYGACKACRTSDCDDSLCDGLTVKVFDADGRETYSGKFRLTDDGC